MGIRITRLAGIALAVPHSRPFEQLGQPDKMTEAITDWLKSAASLLLFL